MQFFLQCKHPVVIQTAPTALDKDRGSGEAAVRQAALFVEKGEAGNNIVRAKDKFVKCKRFVDVFKVENCDGFGDDTRQIRVCKRRNVS